MLLSNRNMSFQTLTETPQVYRYSFGLRAFTFFAWTALLATVLVLAVVVFPSNIEPWSIGFLFFLTVCFFVFASILLDAIKALRSIFVSKKGVGDTRSFLAWSEVSKIEVTRRPFTNPNRGRLFYSIVGHGHRIRFSQFIGDAAALIEVINRCVDDHRIEVIQRDFTRTTLLAACERATTAAERRKVLKHGVLTRLSHLPIPST